MCREKGQGRESGERGTGEEEWVWRRVWGGMGGRAVRDENWEKRERIESKRKRKRENIEKEKERGRGRDRGREK